PRRPPLFPYTTLFRSWADDMEWGAAELFRATGESRYLTEAKRYAETAAAEGWMGRQQTRHYQFYPFLNIGHFRLHDLVDSAFQEIGRAHAELQSRENL